MEKFCRLHPDFHIPGEAIVGEGFDGHAYVRKLKAHGVEALAFFAKCHYGYAYYDTAFGNRHPGLKKDMLREITEACRQEGLRFVVYFSVFLDSVAHEKHPGWGIQSPKTGVDAGFDSGNFRGICVSSGYREELFLPQAVEVLRNYPVDEVLLDTMTGFHPCACEACREQYGKPIPKDSSDADWLPYVRWYHGQFEKFFARTAEVLTDASPGVEVIFNWNWGYRQPSSPPKGIGRLEADLIATGRVASPVCRYFAGTGLPFDYMTGRFLHGLGDWSNARASTLLYTASASIAQGGGFYLIDRQLPNGSLEDRSYAIMSEVFGFIRERQRVLGVKHVLETGALFSFETLFGAELEYFPLPEVRKARMDRQEGLARLMIERGRHFTAFNEERLLAVLSELKVVILPEIEVISDGAVEALESWVRAGGKLLLSQPAAVALPAGLQALAGVRDGGCYDGSYGYLAQPQGEAVTVQTPIRRYELLEGTRSWVDRIRPAAGGKFGHGFAPPSAIPEGAFVTSRELGGGKVMLAAVPLFESFQRFPNFYLGDLFERLLDELHPEPLARLESEAQVEMVLGRKGGDLVVNLVNHAGKEELAGYWYPRTEYVPELRGLYLSIRAPKAGRLRMEFVPGDEGREVTVFDGYARVELPELKYLLIVVVPGYFLAS